MELLTTIVFLLLMCFAVLNYVLGTLQKDLSAKMVSILVAIFFLIFAGIVKLIG